MKALQNCAYDMTLQHKAAAIEPLWFALLDDDDCIIFLMLQLLRILSRAYLSPLSLGSVGAHDVCNLCRRPAIAGFRAFQRSAEDGSFSTSSFVEKSKLAYCAIS